MVQLIRRDVEDPRFSGEVGGTPLPGATPLARAVTQAIRIVDERSKLMVEKLEERDPGNPFGVPKYEHMRELADASRWAVGYGLTERETELFRIVVRGHDVGRHQEALDKLDTLRAGRRHGWISAELLEEWGLPDLFARADWECIRQAVIYHAERVVPLDPASTAFKLCYLLRDLDKEEILTDRKYLAPDGIVDQIVMHYSRKHFPDGERALIDHPRFYGAAARTVAALLSSNSRPQMEETDEIDARVSAKVERIMNDGIADDLLAAFAERQAIPVQRIDESLSTYVLCQVAMLFDVRSDLVLRRIIEDPELNRRVAFLQCKLGADSAEMRLIESTLKSYLSERGLELGGDETRS